MSTQINLKNNLDTTLSITHSDGANTKVIDSTDIAVAIDTVADFPANPNNGDVVIVRGYHTSGDGGGGTFIYDSTEVANSNGGTNFSGWIRQYSGAVNVKWFGAKGDGTTDDTVAIQAAIDYCLASPLLIGDSNQVHSLEIDGIFSVEGTLIINYPLDNRGIFNIKGTGKGSGIAIGTQEYLFSSTLDSSSLVYFENLSFNGSYSTSDQDIYVFDLSKLFRITIESCMFAGVRCGYSSNYVQSLRIFNCAFRGIKGTPIVVDGAMFDVSIENNIFEGIGDDAIRKNNVADAGLFSVRIINNVIEGNNGTAIKLLGNAMGVVIDGNYSENNTGNFLVLTTATSCTISNNRIQSTSTNIADISFYEIVVTNSLNCKCFGNNSHDGRLYNITGYADIGDGDYAALALTKNYLSSIYAEKAVNTSGNFINCKNNTLSRSFSFSKGYSGYVTNIQIQLNGTGNNLLDSIIVEIIIAAYPGAKLDYIYTAHANASVTTATRSTSSIASPTYVAAGEATSFTISTSMVNPVVLVRVTAGGLYHDNSLNINPTITFTA